LNWLNTTEIRICSANDARRLRIDQDRISGEIEMDFIYIALIVGFFVASAGLIRFCAALMEKGGKS
jgi:hypothetical protein